MAESQIERIMKNLKVDRATAEKVLADDKAIDQGKRMDFDLTPEMERMAKKYANATEHRITAPVKRERKPNLTKGGIVQALYDFLSTQTAFDCSNVEKANPERMIKFNVGEFSYDLTLIQHRPK